jgi:hypothetical protein
MLDIWKVEVDDLWFNWEINFNKYFINDKEEVYKMGL